MKKQKQKDNNAFTEKLRAVFDAAGLRSKLSWDQIYERLQRNESLRSIAPKAGVSPAIIAKYYKKYFKPLFPYADANERRFTFQTKQRLKRLQRAAQKLPAAPHLQRVATIARKRRYSVEQIPRETVQRGQRFSTRALLINGWRCHVSDLQHVLQPASGSIASYSLLKLSHEQLAEYDFFIIWQHCGDTVKQFHIIPSEDIAERVTGNGVALYFPVVRGSKRPRKLRYQKYRNAWKLLAREPKTAKAAAAA